MKLIIKKPPAGIYFKEKQGMFIYQRTIKNKVSCFGIGLHTGMRVDMALLPAEEDAGIIFKRVDVGNKDPFIKASYENVSNTLLGTTLRNNDGIHVATIEHLMAALWGCGVDNCMVEINGPEVPIMDGSSEPFVFLIECAGVQEQKKTRKVIEVLKEITVYESNVANSGYMTIAPADSFSVNLHIDFGESVISSQDCTFNLKNVSFKSDICRARTFGFEHEVETMRRNGLAQGGSLDNAIVIGKDGVLNKEGLRYSDEFVRHKVLDCIGDAYLAGGYLQGSLKGFKSGHALNNQLLRSFFADKDAWRIAQIPEAQPVIVVHNNFQ
jgi:UDP-3-O-[3-hydroxymyristoyl] N-acetylglucosamine deacetylase